MSQQPNPDTEDIKLHVKPGKTRAPFFRYIRINLPRLTKAAILVIVAPIGGCAWAVLSSGFDIFAGSDIALGLVIALVAVFLVLGLVTKWRIWGFGTVVAAAGILVYLGGLFGHAPFVGNGAGVYLAAGWNTMFFASLAYCVIYWALNYGVLVAYPDTQGFED